MDASYSIQRPRMQHCICFSVQSDRAAALSGIQAEDELRQASWLNSHRECYGHLGMSACPVRGGVDHSHRAPPQLSLSLTRTCRQTYSETALLPFELHTFLFWAPRDVDTFVRKLLSPQRQAVKSISLSSWYGEWLLGCWRSTMLTSVAKLRHLQYITILTDVARHPDQLKRLLENRAGYVRQLAEYLERVSQRFVRLPITSAAVLLTAGDLLPGHDGPGRVAPVELRAEVRELCRQTERQLCLPYETQTSQASPWTSRKRKRTA